MVNINELSAYISAGMLENTQLRRLSGRIATRTVALGSIAQSKHPGLFRVHEGPTPEKKEILQNYLKATGLKVGLIINFGARSLQWKRMVL